MLRVGRQDAFVSGIGVRRVFMFWTGIVGERPSRLIARDAGVVGAIAVLLASIGANGIASIFYLASIRAFIDIARACFSIYRVEGRAYAERN